MSTLGLMNSLDGVVKIPRMRMTLLVGIISTIVGICGIYNYFINFLNVLGILIAPLSGNHHCGLFHLQPQQVRRVS